MPAITDDFDQPLERESLVPYNAGLRHGHWVCRLLRHRGLEWEEDTERISETGRRTTLVHAACMSCGRGQPRVRVVYPPGYTITVAGDR